MSKWLYIIDYNTCSLYEEEITEKEFFDATELLTECLLKSLGFNIDEVSYMFSEHRLPLITELIKDRKNEK